LAEVLERFLVRHHAAVRQAAVVAPEPPAPAPEAETATAAEEATQPGGAPVALRKRAQQESAQRRERRLARYTEAIALHQEGKSLRALSEQLGLSRMTARKYLRAGGFPELAARRSLLGADSPHGAYLRERWAEGSTNAAELYRELQARGFTGSAGTVRRWVGAWRDSPARRGRPARRASRGIAPKPPSVRPPPPRQVLWLLLRSPEERSPAQQAFLDRLRDLCPAVSAAESLAREFRRLVRTRDAPAFTIWLDTASQGDLPEFREFAAGLRRDRAAVTAALTTSWSNGMVEGFVHKVKLIKRQGYGRANFDLLKQRVLRAA
jgi:transposase